MYSVQYCSGVPGTVQYPGPAPYPVYTDILCTVTGMYGTSVYLSCGSKLRNLLYSTGPGTRYSKDNQKTIISTYITVETLVALYATVLVQ